MADSKELLTDILDGVTALQMFLLRELSKEPLSQGCEAGRQNACRTIEGILKKIRNAHPSIRPRVNTPGGMKKPAPPPPLQPPATLPEGEEEAELYEEAQQAEDYLSFEPARPLDQGEEPQEMYEAMANAEEQDVYEEPVSSSAPGHGPNIDVGEPADTYDDPMVSHPSASSLPPRSQENSGSGAEYAPAIRRNEVGPETNVEMSMDWGSVYQTMPNKGEKVKVSALKNVIIKGYLEKLGGRNHRTWQKRYCVLSGQLMYFYEKEGSKTYNNCIALPTFTSSLAENMTKASEKKFAFKLSQTDSSTNKKKDYYFRANSSDVRNKWLSSIGKAILPTLTSDLGPARTPSPGSATLPRHLPSQSSSLAPIQRQRTLSAGEHQEPEELYEDMVIPEEKEEEDQDEYVAVSPADQKAEELESSEEYVDVQQQQDVDQEEYEDTTAYQPKQQQMPPPPPLSPPPGPPSEMFPSPPLLPNKTPAPKLPPPPPPPEVDTDRIYEQPTTNGIRLEKVFVSLWDFAASEADELALSRGDLIYVNSPHGSAEWWFGELLEPDASRKLGKTGFFPRAYSTEAFEQLSS